jgi:hypothetical protein
MADRKVEGNKITFKVACEETGTFQAELTAGTDSFVLKYGTPAALRTPVQRLRPTGRIVPVLLLGPSTLLALAAPLQAQAGTFSWRGAMTVLLLTFGTVLAVISAPYSSSSRRHTNRQGVRARRHLPHRPTPGRQGPRPLLRHSRDRQDGQVDLRRRYWPRTASGAGEPVVYRMAQGRRLRSRGTTPAICSVAHHPNAESLTSGTPGQAKGSLAGTANAQDGDEPVACWQSTPARSPHDGLRDGFSPVYLPSYVIDRHSRNSCSASETPRTRRD